MGFAAQLCSMRETRGSSVKPANREYPLLPCPAAAWSVRGEWAGFGFTETKKENEGYLRSTGRIWGATQTKADYSESRSSVKWLGGVGGHLLAYIYLWKNKMRLTFMLIFVGGFSPTPDNFSPCHVTSC